MADVDKYASRFLAMSNAPEFCSLDDKIDLPSGESYGELSSDLTLEAQLGAEMFDMDEDKLEFLSRMFYLGKIDGGNVVLDKINEELVARGLEPIKELDIAFRNFTAIFPSYQNSYTRDELTEIFNMIMRKSTTDYGKLIEIISDLQRISQYMRINYNWDASKMMSYEYSQLEITKGKFLSNKIMTLSEDAQKIINQINSINHAVDRESILQIVDEIESGSKTKEACIQSLNNFKYNPQKKTRGIS